MARDSKPSTPEEVEWRKRDAAARAQAIQETQERYPVLTSENAREAVEFQERRIREILKEA